MRLQPCFSPVWDTALTLNALLDAGLSPSSERVQSGVEWLLAHEVREPGDWQLSLPGVEPGGWYFEYANEFYPDCDDTAEVLSLLARVEMVDPAVETRRQEAVRRGLAWQRAMQNRDGGWGAFDRECNRQFLTYVPFADHNAMIDPSTADITARSIEAFVAHGDSADREEVGRALDFLLREQESDGSWYGRWGVNYLYGTWLALGALRMAGVAAREPFSSSARRGADWLLGCQNDDGGWGESAASYASDEQRGRGDSTSSQTSWAMLGLLSAESFRWLDAKAGFDQEETARRERVLAALGRGAEYLVRTQCEHGVWSDRDWTGTGFPSVFYLRYHYYDHYFPLQALAAYRETLRGLDALAPSMASGRPS